LAALRVRQGGYIFPTSIAIISEWVRVLARPVTLRCRLRINIIVGQLILFLSSAKSVGLFFPFNYIELIRVLITLTFIGAVLFLLLAEFGVAILQSFIFVGLLVFFAYEVVYTARHGSYKFKGPVAPEVNKSRRSEESQKNLLEKVMRFWGSFLRGVKG